jgi:hypothetical protein
MARAGSIVLRFTPQNAIQQTAHKRSWLATPAGWILPSSGRCVWWGWSGGILFFVAKIAPSGSFLEGRGFLIALPAAVLGLPAGDVAERPH